MENLKGGIRGTGTSKNHLQSFLQMEWDLPLQKDNLESESIYFCLKQSGVIIQQMKIGEDF